MSLSHFWQMDRVALQRTPVILRCVIELIPTENFNARPLADHFTAAEVLHHMAEMETIHLDRYRTIAECDLPKLPAHDPQERLDQNAYTGLSAAEGLERFAAARAASLLYLSDLSADVIARHGLHPDDGAMSIEDQVRKCVAHDMLHIADILTRTKDRRS